MRLLLVFLFLCGTSHSFSLVATRRISTRRAPLQTGICRAKPGQSEAEAKAERALEISNKIAALKSAGKFKDNAEETMMQEAEQFMNKESPMAKFERRAKERKEKEAQEQEQDIPDAPPATAPAPASQEQDIPDEGQPAEDKDGTDPAKMDGSVDPIREGGAADPPKNEGSWWDRVRDSLS